jgi:excisionase family DNA binding protein
MDPYPSAGPESGPVLSCLRRAIVAIALDDPVIRDHLRLAMRVHAQQLPSPVSSPQHERVEKRLLSIPDVSETLSLSEPLVKRLVQRGTLFSVKVGARRLVPASSVDTFVEQIVAAQNQGARV